MKLPKSAAILLLFFLSPIAFAETVRVKVVDESGSALSDSLAEIWFLGFTGREDRKLSGSTNQEGVFVGTGNASYTIDLVVTKPGFYESEIKGLQKDEDHDLEVVLRRKKNPVALIVRSVNLEVPELGRPIGFDLAAGDWVAPHGIGTVSDFFIDFKREFKGMKYSGRKLDLALEISKRASAARGETWSEEAFQIDGGKWDTHVVLTFADGGGLVRETDGFIRYSKMQLPHEAPRDGYSGVLDLPGSNYGQAQEPLAGGYFLRTRVKKRELDIEKANYSKIIGGFQTDARGKISFTYYFNPSENDRNLEFDPASNLATEQRRVYYP